MARGPGLRCTRPCSRRANAATTTCAAGPAASNASPTTCSPSHQENSPMQHRIVSRDEWLAARQELLRKEKEFTRLRDQLSAERRALPWVEVDKNYVFDGTDGEVRLADLF